MPDSWATGWSCSPWPVDCFSPSLCTEIWKAERLRVKYLKSYVMLMLCAEGTHFYMKGLVIMLIIDLQDLLRGQDEKLFHVYLLVKG